MSTLEICAATIAAVRAAREGGAQRVELCSGLSEGGLTPSVGLIRAAREVEGLRLHVLIRPRGGDFLYTEDEKFIILDDIAAAIDAGVDGVVIGALLADGRIDVDFMQQCVERVRRSEAANSPEVGCSGSWEQRVSLTFHRAFDLCRNPHEALQQLIQLGFDRLLTSGQAATAEAGIPLIRQLVDEAQGRLIIMPGCGVNTQNAARILHETGATEIHASARHTVESLMTFRHPNVAMGTPGADEYAIKDTSPSLVRTIMQSF